MLNWLTLQQFVSELCQQTERRCNFEGFHVHQFYYPITTNNGQSPQMPWFSKDILPEIKNGSTNYILQILAKGYGADQLRGMWEYKI